VDAAVAMKPLPAKNPGEPFLSMPIPSGWEPAHDRDSALVRGALVNTDLRAHGFSPTALMTLADVSEDSHTAAQAIETEHAGIAAEITVTSVENGTLCGYPSRTLRYRYEDRDATTVIVAGTDASNKTWVCTMGLQTTDPHNPQFIRDKAVILEKFQFLLPQDKDISQ
jgi:hypothetical protein